MRSGNAPEAAPVLLVDTSSDSIADDGRLSLREALDAANARPGLDAVAFSPEVAKGEIVLTQGTLLVADDLDLQGGGVTLRTTVGDDGVTGDALLVDTAGVTLEDVVVAAGPGGYGLMRGVVGIDADIVLRGSGVQGFQNADFGVGIDVSGGSLALYGSRVTDSGGLYGAGIIGRQAAVRLVESAVEGTVGGYVPAIDVRGSLSLERSTVADNLASNGPSGIRVEGYLSMTDSTVARNETFYPGYAGNYGAVQLAPGSQGVIAASTIAGNFGYTGDTAGLYVPGDASVVVRDSLIAGNLGQDGNPNDVIGTVVSNGHNVFGQAAVAGAAPGDALGIPIGDLFDATELLDVFPKPILLPVLADNGGPTRTMALKDDPSNPAIGRADPETAPPIDQRGEPRDEAPDAGAFEAGGGGGTSPSLPPLAEKVPVDPDRINGVDPDLLRGNGGDAFKVGFVFQEGAQDNALGYYVVGPDGAIGGVGILFASDEAAAPGDAALTPVLAQGETLGLFLVADGAARNPAGALDGAGLAFVDGRGAPAFVDDPRPRLVFDDGTEVGGRVLHAVAFGDGEGNPLNPQDGVRALSGLDGEGGLLVAFEDKAFDPDLDFNDLVIRVAHEPGEPTLALDGDPFA